MQSLAAPVRRVLVVEDNLDAVHSMATLVKLLGHEVRFAINRGAALDIARSFQPDVVLVGKIAQELEREEALKDTRFVSISQPLDAKGLQAVLDAHGKTGST